MRNVTLAIFCLWLALPQSGAAADRIKIEIVESTMKTETIDVTIPASAEEIETHCTADGRDCKTTVKPATPPTPGKRLLFQFFAKAIFPDGSHVSLLCLAPGDNDCAGIPANDPQKAPSSSCETAANVTTCTDKNLGTYQVKRDKNDPVIYGPKGKVKYRIVGSW
jgi:hypothetical protein